MTQIVRVIESVAAMDVVESVLPLFEKVPSHFAASGVVVPISTP
jgi:hypothetical protein